MRIAFDAKRAFANSRGLGNYSRDILRLEEQYAPENEYVLFGCPTGSYNPGVASVISPRGLWRLFPSLWRSWGCIGQMEGIDIYHGLSGELPFGIHRKGLKTVVTIHDAIFMRYPELYSTTYRWIFARKVQYACDHADIIIAISEQTKRDIITYFHADERKIKVVYQGCNNRFREAISARRMNEVRTRYNLPERYLLAVGAIEPRKNLKNLIEAMHLAQTDLPLIAVGNENAYAGEIAQFAKERQVDLRYLYRLPFDDLPMVYKGATLFCYPSLFEGFGIPILESMCVGTPVLTSTGSCFAETGGNAALYADPLQPEHIAEQMKRILSDEALRQQMIAKGHEQAEQFTDEKVARNILNTYTL